MADYQAIKEEVYKLGLKPATQRDLPLFTLSCIGRGYMRLMKDLIGLSYNGIIAIGSENKFHTMLNEGYIAGEIKKIAQPEKIKEEILPKARSLAEEMNMNLELLKYLSERDTLEFFKKVAVLYPRYLTSIGAYNGFWRFIGNDSKIFPKELIDQISSEREQAAKIYPEVEKLIKIASGNHGKKGNHDGELLKYMTLTELEQYLDSLNISENQIDILKKRRTGYLFYLVDGDEKVIHEEDILRKFKEDFFLIKEEIDQIMGNPAFNGKIRGMAYNFEKSNKITELANVILIAGMTRPEDTPLLKNCLAIVTDEGGILCHAAIVSRELKIPCIVGTNIATRVIRTGDFLEVDADNGIIKILEKVKN